MSSWPVTESHVCKECAHRALDLLGCSLVWYCRAQQWCKACLVVAVIERPTRLDCTVTGPAWQAW